MELKRYIDGVLVEHRIDDRQIFTSNPPSEWPLWAKALKLLSKPGDKGIGDVFERVVGPIGGEAYQRWHIKTHGVPCPTCRQTKELWNQRYPLTPSP